MSHIGVLIYDLYDPYDHYDLLHPLQFNLSRNEPETTPLFTRHHFFKQLFCFFPITLQ